jgi:hypothetical protein
MVELNNFVFEVAGVTANTFELLYNNDGMSGRQHGLDRLLERRHRGKAGALSPVLRDRAELRHRRGEPHSQWPTAP